MAYLLATRLHLNSLQEKVVFRPNGEALTCRSTDDLRVLLDCVYAASLFDETVPAFASSILSIASTLNNKIRQAFTDEEISRSAPGGAPGLKDVLLYLLVKTLAPGLVVETGVAQGVSTTFLLQALEKTSNGRLISVDLPNYNPAGYTYPDHHLTHDPVFVRPELGVGWLVPPNLRTNWTLLIGPSNVVLNDISMRIDMFYHDSMHSYDNMMFEFSWGWTHLNSGGVLVADDIGWNQAFSDFVRRVGRSAELLCDRGIGILRKKEARRPQSATAF